MAKGVVSVTEGSGAATPYSGFPGVRGRMGNSSNKMMGRVGSRGLTMVVVVR
jgi:hypothetical protein